MENSRALSAETGAGGLCGEGGGGSGGCLAIVLSTEQETAAAEEEEAFISMETTSVRSFVRSLGTRSFFAPTPLGLGFRTETRALGKDEHGVTVLAMLDLHLGLLI